MNKLDIYNKFSKDDLLNKLVKLENDFNKEKLILNMVIKI